MQIKHFMFGVTLAAFSLTVPAHAQGIYAKAGILGAGLGYFHGVTDQLSLRADVSTVGRIRRNFGSGSVDYKARLDANQLGVYGDWFPFDNGFRISGGMHLRKLQAQAQGIPTAAGQVTINNTTVNYDVNDALIGRVKFPSVAPYLGIGWGYHATQQPGFGFVVDLGVSFGRPKVSLDLNNNLQAKLNAATAGTGVSAAAELESERRELKDKADKFKFFPQVYVGVSYRF